MKKNKLIFILFGILLIYGCTENYENPAVAQELSICDSEDRPAVHTDWSCINEIAMKYGDIRVCNKLPKKCGFMSFSESCPQDFCVVSVAVSQKNEAICENAKFVYNQAQDICYRDVARIKKDDRLCEKINHPVIKDICYAHSATEISTCYKISRMEEKNTCYSFLANDKLETQFCDKIENPRPEPDMAVPYKIYGCYTSVAAARKDLAICDRFMKNHPNIISYPEACYREVTVALQDESLCEKAHDPESADLIVRDSCYREIAILKGDSKLCDKVSADSGRDYCLRVINPNTTKKLVRES